MEGEDQRDITTQVHGASSAAVLPLAVTVNKRGRVLHRIRCSRGFPIAHGNGRIHPATAARRASPHGSVLLVLTGLADGDDTALRILLRFKVSHLYLRLFGFGFRWHLITSFRLRAACDEISARSQGRWLSWQRDFFSDAIARVSFGNVHDGES